MLLNRGRLPGSLGLELRQFQRQSDERHLQTILTVLRLESAGHGSSPVPPLTKDQMVSVLDRAEGRSQSFGKPTALERAPAKTPLNGSSNNLLGAPSKAKETAGDKQNALPNTAPLEAALQVIGRAGIVIR